MRSLGHRATAGQFIINKNRCRGFGRSICDFRCDLRGAGLNFHEPNFVNDGQNTGPAQNTPKVVQLFKIQIDHFKGELFQSSGKSDRTGTSLSCGAEPAL